MARVCVGGRCVRVDAAFSVGLSRGAPAWINPPHRQRTALCGWIVDERLCSFVAVPLVSECFAVSLVCN